MSNIEEHFEFDYAAESAKVGFQSTINCLLEMQSEISARMSYAKEHGKNGVYFTIGELEVQKSWILDTATALLEHYRAIDKTNRFLNKRFKLLSVVASKIKAA